MSTVRLLRLVVVLATCALLGACGSSAPGELSMSATGETTVPGPARVPAPAHGSRSAHTSVARLLDWPEFGLNQQRSDTSPLSTGIDAANVAHLRHVTVSLPGTIDSSPIYLHQTNVAGATRSVVVATTTYGRTLALDPDSGHILWTFTPSGYAGWAGSAQITVTSPVADPSGGFIYAASPNGLIHKLSLSDGSEVRSGAWPVSVTRDATHEKLGAALNLDGRYVIAATSGYIGDIPPYQGHVVLIDRASGRIVSVFNTLCSDRRRLIAPSSCSASDSAILSRGGAVVEPGGRRLLVATGNAPWNGATNLGDSVIELMLPDLRLRQAFTPANQAELNENDLDLGSSAPVLLGQNRVLITGKDGIMRVLSLSQLDGRAPSVPSRLGGEVQRLPLPGGGELFTAAAVWHQGAGTTVFIGAERATAAYALSGGRLRRLWQNDNPGTSPVLAGGLLYVYDPSGGGIYVYRPHSGHPVARLPGSPGHWNSPIVVDGHVVEPTGNANDHRLTGSMELFSAQ
ncbi:MAG TPA: PQQ-binding-like beta-propeller repeat protein [Solirubrobacteraceae bacterium]|nr:PQQ-binding-like beta-propeller repeat protein [Solirubrobacteraceae bacterium]